MTTRPTDEEISALIKEARRNSDYDYAEALEAWLAERQAARDGVTDEMVAIARNTYRKIIVEASGNVARDELHDEAMRAALQSIVQPVRVPEKKRLPSELSSATDYYNDGWNDAIDEMISIPPQPQQAVLGTPAFKRENRYLVIKVKDLLEEKLKKLLLYMMDNQIPTRKSVVVEHDWPEYETVWAMIERRMLSADPAYNGKKEE